ncbi:hypothetical protein BJH93_13645 [Kocuria polaris]|nr:hypothetical protein [Kocuria polaris]
MAQTPDHHADAPEGPPAFDKAFWDEHWESPERDEAATGSPPNPYVLAETGRLTPGTALDAGCGTGAEAVALAGAGWQVTGVDISERAVGEAERRANGAGVAARTEWLAADLTTWEPDEQQDLVMTNYAHPSIPQLEFYRRISAWVAPGGTLLIVGHLHHGGRGHDGEHESAHGHESGHGHDDGWPPEEATATGAGITGLLDPEEWRVETATEYTRDSRHGDAKVLRDVVVRATRTGGH